MQPILVTDATTEPVSRVEMKAHLRVDFSDEDALIDSLIAAARKKCQDSIDQQFITATWKVVLDRFPRWCIELPRPPLISVSSITYLD